MILRLSLLVVAEVFIIETLTDIKTKIKTFLPPNTGTL